MSTDWKSHLLEALHLQHTADAVKAKVVPHHRASIWYYFGGLALMFFAIQVATGIMLLFYYEPTAELAHKSIGLLDLLAHVQCFFNEKLPHSAIHHVADRDHSFAVDDGLRIYGISFTVGPDSIFCNEDRYGGTEGITLGR